MAANSSRPDPVLYVITCGTPAARGVPAFVKHAQATGWRVCAVPTPMGANFLDIAELEDLTGFPVRTTYKHPDDPDLLPPADAFAVAPATFNTVNKIAGGITDTLAVGLVCEGIGYRRPVIIAPWMNRALACHGSYARSLKALEAEGVHLVLTDGTQPGGDPHAQQGAPFPWARLGERLSSVLIDLKSAPTNQPLP